MEKLKFFFVIFEIIVVAAIIIGVAIYTVIQIRKYKKSNYAFQKNDIVKNTGFTITLFTILLICFIAAAKFFY